MSETLHGSHSADVKIWLDCGEHGQLLLNRVTPRWVVAKIPRNIPPCIADLVVVVDGQPICRKVRLVKGFSSENPMALALPADRLPF